MFVWRLPGDVHLARVPGMDDFFTPVSGMELPRYAGVPTFMRLPHVPPGHGRFGDVQIGLIGVVREEPRMESLHVGEEGKFTLVGRAT